MNSDFLKKLDSNAPIVHVDDDLATLMIVERGYRKSDLKFPWLSFSDPLKFVSYMCDGEPPCPLPAFVLLDINMPGMNGFEVLKKIRTFDIFKELPTLMMLTSSEQVGDIEKAKSLGANSYTAKLEGPAEYKEFFNNLIT